MKFRNVFLFVCLAIIMAGCSNDDLEQETPQIVKSEQLHFSGVKNLEGKQTRGIAQTPKLWNRNATIRIKFLNGTQEMQNLVKEYASEWLTHIDLKFSYVTSGESEVRIAFEDDFDNANKYVSWSYTGTDCRSVSQNEATANFAFFNDLQSFEKKGVVLRVFGQILGLELEHRHLNANLTWTTNVNRIKQYWENNIYDISWSELQRYVFTPIEDLSIVTQTRNFDAESIMIWQFPSNLVSGLGYTNYELSEKDIEFIISLYGEETYKLTGPDKLYIGTNGEYVLNFPQKLEAITNIQLINLPGCTASTSSIYGAYVGAKATGVTLVTSGCKENTVGKIRVTLADGKILYKIVELNAGPSLRFQYLIEGVNTGWIEYDLIGYNYTNNSGRPNKKINLKFFPTSNVRTMHWRYSLCCSEPFNGGIYPWNEIISGNTITKNLILETEEGASVFEIKIEQNDGMVYYKKLDFLPYNRQ